MFRFTLADSAGNFPVVLALEVPLFILPTIFELLLPLFWIPVILIEFTRLFHPVIFAVSHLANEVFHYTLEGTSTTMTFPTTTAPTTTTSTTPAASTSSMVTILLVFLVFSTVVRVLHHFLSKVHWLISFLTLF